MVRNQRDFELAFRYSIYDLNLGQLGNLAFPQKSSISCLLGLNLAAIFAGLILQHSPSKYMHFIQSPHYDYSQLP
jgi:hypothetical protein